MMGQDICRSVLKFFAVFRELFPYMRLTRLIIAAAVATLVCVVPSLGKPWRGIVPLRSTRAEVERLLGSPAPGTQNVYKTSTETVSVTYAETHCAYGWRVPPGTVVSLLISPTTPTKLTDLKLEESKYEKRKDYHLENVHYYIDANEGINYTIDAAQGLVTTVEHYPQARDSHLACFVKAIGGIKAGPKPAVPSKTRPKTKVQLQSSAPTFVCPMHPDVVSSKRGSCRRCGMRLRLVLNGASVRKPIVASRVEAAQHPTSEQRADVTGQAATGAAGSWGSLSSRDRVLEMERLAPTLEYTCLMHKEIHEAQPGMCPKCGMPLSTVKPSVRGEYNLLLTPQPQAPRAGEKVLLRFSIANPQTGALVKDYVTNHEKLFHLFIVSQDLSEYQHIHPIIDNDGTFSVETILPRAGLYKLHADFFPIGGMPQIIHRELVTAGHLPPNAPGLPTLTPDATLAKTLDGMKITLEPGGPLVAGTLIPLTYRLTDLRTGEPLRDLEPYLGAWGHTLILNADQSEYLHTHPSEMLATGIDRATLRGGPNLEFKAMFPAAGDYRIWTQFQRGARVTTVSFTVRVQP